MLAAREGLGDIIADACAGAPNGPLADGDVLVVTQKIVSKAEGRVVDLADAALPGRAGVRNQNIDAAKGFDGFLHRRLDLIVEADIAGQRQRLAASRFNSRRGTLCGIIHLERHLLGGKAGAADQAKQSGEQVPQRHSGHDAQGDPHGQVTLERRHQANKSSPGAPDRIFPP
mgnify:CR=1 FL=1